MLNADEARKRADKLFEERKEYEALWETAYKYLAPERALFFDRRRRSPNEIQDEVFDSTAIDAAERLTNLIMSGLTPPWQKWIRITPGSDIRDTAEREAMREPLTMVEDRLFAILGRSGFYQELQPLILDRIVGGTGAMCAVPDPDGAMIRFKNVPLGEIAVEEDNAGRIVTIARRYRLSFAQLERQYGSRLPQEFRNMAGQDASKQHDLYAVNALDAAGLWQWTVTLRQHSIALERTERRYPYLFVTRWSKLPGSVYGRGPGLRVLSDVRMLNKIKELSLKNAAKSVAGVYTVVDDGVVNPYTLTMEPGTFLSVGSNDRQNPSISELPQTGNFDVSMFIMEDLRNSVLSAFMADRFGPMDRTPMTATEIQARSQVIAQDMGATIARMQHELLLPILRAVLGHMSDMELIPPGLDLNGTTFDVEFVSQLSQAQWAIEKQNLLEFTTIATQFGEIDPQAGLIINVHKALSRVAELDHIPPEVLRPQEEIEQLIQQAAEAQAEQEQQEMEGAAPPGDM